MHTAFQTSNSAFNSRITETVDARNKLQDQLAKVRLTESYLERFTTIIVFGQANVGLMENSWKVLAQKYGVIFFFTIRQLSTSKYAQCG